MKSMICAFCCIENEIDETATAWKCSACGTEHKILTNIPKGKKFDKGKLDYALLPLVSIKEVIKVLMFGEEKYGRDNWQLVGNHRTRYYNAAMRHIADWFEGRKKDKETKLHPIAHAVCCLLFLIWFDKRRK